MKMKQITLQSSHTIPQIGLGTWQILDEDCTKIVKDAINVGYTHIDTALRYHNHRAIAKTIKGTLREKLFITSKIWFDDLSYLGVKQQVERILKELDTHYVDLCLIHWPNREFNMKDTFQAFKELVDEGSVKSVGVSNFTINHLKDTLEISQVPICVNQVEFHYKLFQKELLEFCNEHNIVVEAYSPLSHGEFLNDQAIIKLAEKYEKSPAQILLRWLIEKNIVIIPKTAHKERLVENILVYDFELSKEDHELINSLNENKRIINPFFSDFDY
ncbi:MAG: aldo/keto reductase [Candidatus Nanoarchaeia archaeon]